MADLERKQRSSAVGITGDDEQYIADVTPAGGKNRLAVDAAISVATIEWVPSYTGSKYRTAWSRSDTSAGSTVYSFTGSGTLESFLLDMESKDGEVVLKIDGTTVYDIDCSVFADVKYKADKHIELPFGYMEDEKCFIHHPRYPMKFSTSFEIIINNKKAKGHVVTYYED
jgi:hypothetical protein